MERRPPGAAHADFGPRTPDLWIADAGEGGLQPTMNNGQLTTTKEFPQIVRLAKSADFAEFTLQSPSAGPSNRKSEIGNRKSLVVFSSETTPIGSPVFQGPRHYAQKMRNEKFLQIPRAKLF